MNDYRSQFQALRQRYMPQGNMETMPRFNNPGSGFRPTLPGFRPGQGPPRGRIQNPGLTRPGGPGAPDGSMPGFGMTPIVPGKGQPMPGFGANPPRGRGF